MANTGVHKAVATYKGWQIFKVGDRFEAYKGHKLTYRYRSLPRVKAMIREIERVGK